jgi:Phage integrase family
MDKTTLGDWFGTACKAIGLDRSAHGLRKASARLYAERGASVSQLMALFGWRTPAMAMRYVAMADRKRMALDAQAAMDWDQIRNRNSPTGDSGGGSVAKVTRNQWVKFFPRLENRILRLRSSARMRRERPFPGDRCVSPPGLSDRV